MKNTKQHYGWVTITIHWLVAVIIIGLFSLGFWMVELGYYHPWYKQGPDLHRSIGIVLFALMVFRLILKIIQTKPVLISSHSKLEHLAGSLTHKLLYILVFVIMFSGYLISTADGRAIEVFQLITVPSLGELFSNQEDIAGLIHQYVAYSLMAIVIVHALAALKHHFIDKDNTLTRMLGNRQ